MPKAAVRALPLASPEGSKQLQSLSSPSPAKAKKKSTKDNPPSAKKKGPKKSSRKDEAEAPPVDVATGEDHSEVPMEPVESVDVEQEDIEDIPPDAAAFLAEVLAGTPRGKPLTTLVHTPRGTLREVQDSATPSSAAAPNAPLAPPPMRPPANVVPPPPPQPTTASGVVQLMDYSVHNEKNRTMKNALMEEIKRKSKDIDFVVHRRGINSEIADAGADATKRLRKVASVSDRSMPVIASDAKIKSNPAVDVFAEVRRGYVILKHVDSSNDRSAPLIETSTRIERSTRPALFDELKRKMQQMGRFLTG